ncbi:transglycosylase SLT domain-containing protein [Eionea flava]
MFDSIKKIARQWVSLPLVGSLPIRTYPLHQDSSRRTGLSQRGIAYSVVLLSTLFYSHTVLSKVDATAGSAVNIPSDVFATQRSLYLKAKQAFENRDYTGYQTLRDQLVDYPLHPYLIYGELSLALDSRKKVASINKYGVTGISTSNKKTITQFLKQYENSYLATRLRVKWLYHLAELKNWPDYKRYYRDSVKKTDLKCLSLQAQIYSDGTLDTDTVDQLWLSSQSRPKACDPVFAEWKKRGHLNQENLWQRYTLAINKGNTSLAKYLHGKMDASNRYLANLYSDVHQSPEKVSVVTSKKLKTNNGKVLEYQPANDAVSRHIVDIIEHGLYRYAYREPAKTQQLYQQFQTTYDFSQEASIRLNQRIARQLIRQGELELAKPLLKALPVDQRADQVEYLLRKLLAKQAWSEIYVWINQLPDELIASDRWQYWRARALESPLLLAKKSAETSPENIYQQLSQSRSFYGFLASDRQSTDYQYEDKPAPINPSLIDALSASGAFLRAREFFIMEDMHRARREWRYAVKNLSTEEFIAAAQIADQWGWNRKAIEAMAGAAYWDDLRIRFPIVHEDIIDYTAKKYDIPSSLVFSIARQESAWEFDATSRVGARGLMQLMPATAKQTAKKARLAYKKSQLFDPKYNISLGSHYITGLLAQYDDNRALAIASYNAGPHRVKQWLKRSNASLPLDVWVEIIPFKETRKYVQNVLSYEVIYNYRQGKASDLLTLAEANALL